MTEIAILCVIAITLGLIADTLRAANREQKKQTELLTSINANLEDA